MGQIWFQTRSIEFEVVRLDRFCRPIDLGHGLLLGWARWARQARQAGPVGPVGARRARRARRWGSRRARRARRWGSRAVLLYEVLGRGSCRDPVEILEDS